MEKIILILLGLITCKSIDCQQIFPNTIVAHRGAWKKDKLPENSLASLRKAIDLKCGGTEFDIWMTADSVCVVNHDADFFNLDIEKVNYNDLLQYSLKNGEKIPTLEEYLLAGSKVNTQTRLVAEIKPSRISGERGKLIASAVMKLVEKHQIQKMVDYISFDIGILQELIRLNPNINTQYLNGELSPAELTKMGINGMDYHFKVYYDKPQWIDEAKRLNMKLNAWTVNKGKDMDFFIRKDFDSITTNEPEKLSKKLSKQRKSK